MRERLSRELTNVATPPWEAVESRRLVRCLAKLTPREQRVLFLSFQEGYTASEVATAIGIEQGNVRVIRHRALIRVRQCVEEPEQGS